MNWRSAWVLGLAFGGSVVFTWNAQIVCAADKPSDPPTQQFFTEHCQKCHSGAKPKGEFNFESLSQDFTDKKNRQQWFAVLEQLNAGNMPPKEEPRPPAEKVKVAAQWISERAGAAEIARRAKEGRVVMRRLNRAEYANAMRDLLRVEVDLSDLLPPDTSTSRFDNSAELLHTSSYLMRSYLEAADRVLDEAIANEPKPWQLKKRFDRKEESSVK